MYIQLYQVKKHLNIDEDFRDDDEYLMQLVQVAEKVVEKNIDIKLEKLEDEDGNIPIPLTQAMLLLVGNFYANRESVAFASTNNVPYSYQYLIDLYRNYRGEDLKKKACLEWHLKENKKKKENEDEESGTINETNQDTSTSDGN
jgi:uncharacterized phage protein (predicted DNA packaging)